MYVNFWPVFLWGMCAGFGVGAFIAGCVMLQARRSQRRALDEIHEQIERDEEYAGPRYWGPQ
jgi:hypothetical protein